MLFEFEILGFECMARVRNATRLEVCCVLRFGPSSFEREKGLECKRGRVMGKKYKLGRCGGG
jgi:hypothetical protein